MIVDCIYFFVFIYINIMICDIYLFVVINKYVFKN